LSASVAVPTAVRGRRLSRTAVYNSVHNPVDIPVDSFVDNFVDRAVESGRMSAAPPLVRRHSDWQEDGELSPVSRETFTGATLCRIFLPNRRNIAESSHYRGQSDLSQSHNQQPSQPSQFVTPATLDCWRVEGMDMSRITETGACRQVGISLWISSVEN
jgi:hypothetical protein